MLTVRDGFILVVALNTALHRSPQSWGFVPTDDLHDTLTDDDNGKAKGRVEGDWTFRRVGNLTAWAACVASSLLIHPSPLFISANAQRPATPLPNPRRPSRAKQRLDVPHHRPAAYDAHPACARGQANHSGAPARTGAGGSEQDAGAGAGRQGGGRVAL